MSSDLGAVLRQVRHLLLELRAHMRRIRIRLRKLRGVLHRGYPHDRRKSHLHTRW